MTDLMNDTIAAVATPPGRGGVAIVRISGPNSRAIAQAVLGHVPMPRRAEYLSFLDVDGRTLDQGIALYFPAPHSFTGEEVLELHGHGGPVIMDMLLKRVVALGARLARPGEFSERAFLNDKIDLVQAEAIADLIASTTQAAARSAQRSLQGEFSVKIDAVVERLISLRMYVEAAIDFAEEEIDFLAEGKIEAELNSIAHDLEHILHVAKQGSLLREGIHVVIAGKPNAGKSSLLNCLAQRETAIVTAIPGTTRDVLRETIAIDDLPLHVIDTAGLRESSDQVEAIGIQRAWAEIEKADHVLLLVDDQHGLDAETRAIAQRMPKSLAMTVVRNKIDLTGRQPGSQPGELGPEIAISAKSGAGIALLKQHLKAAVGYHGGGEGQFMARRRHLEALQRALDFTTAGRAQLEKHRAGELLAEDLRQAQQALGEITGEFSSDDLLGRIFASFCIGK